MIGVIEFLIVLALVWMFFAIVQDFRYREIANWLNFSLIAFALAVRLFYSIFSGNYDFILFGVGGLAVFFILGNLFYYGRFFAGGDAKLLIALGAVIPFAETWQDNFLIFFVFIMALLFAGAIYSLAYSFILVIMNRKKFIKEFKRQIKKNKFYIYVTLILAVVLSEIIILFTDAILLFFPFLIILFPFLFFYTKAIEQCCMIKFVEVSKLTVGDWLAEEIRVKGKKIKPYWEGISEAQLKLIQKNYKKKVLIKSGIPFSLSFLIAFLFIVGIKYLWKSNWGFW